MSERGRIAESQVKSVEDEHSMELKGDALSVLVSESEANDQDAKVAMIKLQHQSAQLKIAQSKEDNRRLELEVKKLEMEFQLKLQTGASAPGLPPLNVSHLSSSVPTVLIGGKRVAMEDFSATGDRSDKRHSYVKVKKEHGTADETFGSWNEANPDSSSGSEDSDDKKSSSTWTKVSRKTNTVVTNGEQSDWERAKFHYRSPIQSLKLEKWIAKVEKRFVNGTNWELHEYESKRKPYAKRDQELYNILIDSCADKTGKSKVKESTMSLAARNGAKSGSIPFGHGALFFLYLDNMFENVKRNDPNYRAGACEDFRNATMSKKQTPLEWKEELQALQNECGGDIQESELVQRYVTKMTPAYDTIIDQCASKDPDVVWSFEDAFKKANLYWTLRVRDSHKSEKRNESSKERHQRKKNEKKQKHQKRGNKEAVSEMFSAAITSTTFCNWCGKPGHVQADCTVEQVEKYCTNCKKSNHWIHQCFDLLKKKKKGGKGKGKGKKGKDGKRKPYQEKHYGIEDAPAPAPAPAPAAAESDSDDSYEEGGWQMNGMSFELDEVPDLIEESSDENPGSDSDESSSTESFFGVPPTLR